MYILETKRCMQKILEDYKTKSGTLFPNLSFLFFYDVILWPKHLGHDVISGLQIRQNFLKILIGSRVVPVSRFNRYAVY